MKSLGLLHMARQHTFFNDKENPEINLKRGITYQIEINTPGHPLWIKTNESPSPDSAYASGITSNGTDRSTITFMVPKDALATLFYNCQYHIVMYGKKPILVTKGLIKSLAFPWHGYGWFR